MQQTPDLAGMQKLVSRLYKDVNMLKHTYIWYIYQYISNTGIVRSFVFHNSFFLHPCETVFAVLFSCTRAH